MYEVNEPWSDTIDRQTNKVFLCFEHRDFSVKMCCHQKVSVTSVVELELAKLK